MAASNGERWLLPVGIEELLPPEAARLETLRRALADLYHRWGYDLVAPPFIEYLDSLLTGTGNDLDLQTFKVTDQLTGRLMGVRADMTPQVARIDAHHLAGEGPVRLCYLGEVLYTRPDDFAGSRNPFQAGAELYGHGGAESDIEVLTLLLETLRLSRVDDVHVDVGHVGIYRALARQAGVDEAAERVLFDTLQRKALPELDAFLAELEIPAASRRMLDGLVDLNGAAEEVLAQARETLAEGGPEVMAALDDLATVSRGVVERMPEVSLYFDLAELRGYNYHTGIVFAAFVPGHGREIARGGRYDDIGRVFGRARPATGFSTDLKTLILLSRAESPPATGGAIRAPWTGDAGLHAHITYLRAGGERVIQELPGQAGTAAEAGCDRELVQRAGEWQVVPLSSPG